MEAIDAGRDIEKVLVRKDLGGELAKELLAKIREHSVVMQRVPQEKLNRITMKNHQGAIAILSAVTYYKLEQLLPSIYEEGCVPLMMVLDGVTDTRNFGAIGRTAECAGFDTVVISEHGSAGVTADAVKTSAGALLHLPVCRERTVAEAVKYLKESGVKVIGTSDAASRTYFDVDYSGPVAIVMGAEDTGISNEVVRQCDELVSIPMLGNISSLNVSVAAGVMAYEAVRQRLKEGQRLK